MIVSQLPIEVFRKYIVDETMSPMTGFTFAVLAIVQLAGGKITEGMRYPNLLCSNTSVLPLSCIGSNFGVANLLTTLYTIEVITDK